MEFLRIIVSGGGTGGHIYPALSIADRIKSENEGAKVLYIGTKKGLESKIVPKSGYDFKTVTVNGFQRKISIENMKRLMMFFKGICEAASIIRSFKPDVVIGTGGYVSGPVVFCAAIMKVPTVVHEQNAFPGITNKFLSRFTDKVLISFEDARKFFKSAQEVEFTGNPVRKEIVDANKIESRKKLGIPLDKKMVLSVGGSGGSRKINDAMLSVIEQFCEKDIAFVHATGNDHFESFSKDFSNEGLKDYQTVLPYIDNMPDVLAACDMVICSAGAITLSEVTCLGKPAIVIPKAHTAENHQEYNARSVEENGAGVMILEKDITADMIAQNIFNILMDEEKLKDMSSKSVQMGRPEAVDLIYSQIMRLRQLDKGI